jgi:glycerol-3-phosphate O-acyltransferase / dihydroxyacetone phosphate acyltransferase
MALGAMANNPDLNMKVVPVGLSYFHAHRFRSRAVIEFGPALDVPAEFVEKFKQGGQEKREAVSKFLDLVYDALKAVTIRAPDYDTLMVGHMGRIDITWMFLTSHFSLFKQRDDCIGLLGKS